MQLLRTVFVFPERTQYTTSPRTNDLKSRSRWPRRTAQGPRSGLSGGTIAHARHRTLRGGPPHLSTASA